MPTPFKSPKTSCCCAKAQQISIPPDNNSKKWNAYYWCAIITLMGLWWLIYANLLPATVWLVYAVFGFSEQSKFGTSLAFFIYDTIKILLLLVALIYSIAWMRASMNINNVRDFLVGSKRGVGYFLGATFGAVTPFCSCSSVPLFLGFTTARIPIGISMAFLITSPLINEIAVILLWGLLGWKFTVTYVAIGMLAGVFGGFIMDTINAERWLQPFILKTISNAAEHQVISEAGTIQRLTTKQRHTFAYSETVMIFQRVWKWVIIGVGIGAALYGFVPENWFAEHFSANQWWTVPAAVFASVPLYSNVTGIIPVMESLLMKGLPLGTTMAFCMGAVVASIPEVMMLRQIMTWRLQVSFVAYLWVLLVLVGWIFNYLDPYIR